MIRIISLTLLVATACGPAKQPVDRPVGAGSQPVRIPKPAPEAPAPDEASTPDEAAEGSAAADAGEAAAEPMPAAPAPIQVGDITITPVYHASMMWEVDGRVVWFDPWSKGALEGRKRADLIVLTDIHGDHADPPAIKTVTKPGTLYLAPKAVDEKLTSVTVNHVLGNGESVEVLGMTFEAVPMYNLKRGPEEGGLFHEKGRGNGYIVTHGDTRIYVAGDTACTEEMKALTDIDHAFVPMNLPYTMPPSEAAACVAAFKPTRVTPFHYAGSDLKVFAKGLAGSGVEIVERDFYPGGEPF